MNFPLNLGIGLMLFFMASSAPTFAVTSSATKVELIEAEHLVTKDKKSERKQRKEIRKALKSQTGSIFSNSKFKLGLLVFTIGFGSSLLSWVLAGAAASVLGYIGIIAIVAGVVLMGWGLLEYLA